jgi:hypothetical protein
MTQFILNIVQLSARSTAQHPIAHYGDLDVEMTRKKLDQTGTNQRFLA